MAYFSIKTKDADAVQKINAKEQGIEMEGLNVLGEEIKTGQVLFIVLGGDRPDWNTGLAGLATVSKEPYDQGYRNRNYRIQIDMKVLLSQPIKREDLVPYKDTYGTIGIAPITKWEPNQAISQVQDEKAIALFRAMLELEKSEEVKKELIDFLGPEVMERVKDETTKMIPVRVKYDECEGEAIEKIISDQEHSKEKINQNKRTRGGLNKIFYGAPGCGKSRYIKNRLDKEGVNKKNRIRVTFHPEYANCDFIGQILPTVETQDDATTGEKRDTVKYVFNPGPFTLALKTAYNTNDMVYLIVEEINRGNAASIFGDMFQLLDREKAYLLDGKDNALHGQSEYPVSNPNMQEYLIRETGSEEIKEQLKEGVFIPSNLTIFATMNSSDQNVFTLDTAFKRRWSFQMMPNDILSDADHAYKNWYVPGTEVTWAAFVTKLNDEILKYGIHNQTNEDKRLGKYFVTRECLTESPNEKDEEKSRSFAYKVLEYIWNDVCKIGRDEWFDTDSNKTLEDLIETFVKPREGESPLSVFKNITSWK